jgi:hypothetical protein
MTNWQLIITLATLVFAIFGANWLNLQLMTYGSLTLERIFRIPRAV